MEEMGEVLGNVPSVTGFVFHRVCILKQLNLTGKNAEQVHTLIQEYSIDAGEKVGFSELLTYVKDVLGIM